MVEPVVVVVVGGIAEMLVLVLVLVKVKVKVKGALLLTTVRM